ncbi:DUF397 domain-containing protein [Streptomyces anulatus]|uniref:DUF397 domain-containing protein n=1 Tax=Streptomyces anulatus TaxID=1892 RepID=UPI002E12D7B3|nr:DUF397 domain-containing protein [Streptomyces anulatus]
MNDNVRGPALRDLLWFKSSYSSGEGGQCIEVAVAAHRAGHGATFGRRHSEVTSCGRAVHVRDSKDATRPGLMVGVSAWTAFVGSTVQ